LSPEVKLYDEQNKNECGALWSEYGIVLDCAEETQAQWEREKNKIKAPVKIYRRISK
jgi:hypothetical protein